MSGINTTIDFNVTLFLKELEKSGFSCTQIEGTPVIRIQKESNVEYLYDLCVSDTSFPAGWIASDKFYTKQFLEKSGIKTASGKVFLSTDQKAILSFAKKISYPVVLKPTTQGHGDHVYSHIDSKEELLEKLEIISSSHAGNGYVLIEKHFEGQEYRLFATNEKFVAAVHRIPASVIADGEQPIILLIQAENYKRMNPRKNCLCEIKLDAVLFDYLEKQGRSINDIPPKGTKIWLRPTSNVSKGGNCHDVTNLVHESIRELAVRAIQSIPGLSLAGVDLLCTDISKPLNSQEYVICELNPSPGLSLHMLPEVGKKRNVAKTIVKILQK